MKLYWGLNTIPELQGLPKAQQRQLWRVSQRAAHRTPHVWAIYALMVLMYGGMYLLNRNSVWALPGGDLAGMVVAVLGGILLGGIPAQLLVRATRPFAATRRAAMEASPPATNGSYHVPPAF